MLALMLPRVRGGLAQLPGALSAGRLRPWHLFGGLGGAWLVTTQGIVVGVVGVTVFIVGVVAGQVAGSLAVDRLGLSPAGAMPVNRTRAIAAVLAVLAVSASGWGSLAAGGVDAAVAVGIAATAGLAISVQQAINARVSAAADDAVAAAAVNFTVGFTALSIGVVIGRAAGGIDLGALPAQPVLYIGGPIGVAFIAMAAWAVRGLGVLAFGLLAIAGQLAGGVVLDVLAPAASAPFGPLTAAGLLAAAAAVWLAGRGSARPGGRSHSTSAVGQ